MNFEFYSSERKTVTCNEKLLLTSRCISILFIKETLNFDTIRSNHSAKVIKPALQQITKEQNFNTNFFHFFSISIAFVASIAICAWLFKAFFYFYYCYYFSHSWHFHSPFQFDFFSISIYIFISTWIIWSLTLDHLILD